MEKDGDGGGLHHHAIRVLPSAPDEVAMEQEITSEPNSCLHEKAVEIMASSMAAYRSKPLSFWALLVLSGGAMLTAFPASSLLSRLYYNDGGQSKWILSWSAVAGWPLPALLLLPYYLLGKASPTPLSLRLCFWYVLLGFLSAGDNLMYAWAYAHLPASTASLVAASSLVFSAIFGRLIVKNRLPYYLLGKASPTPLSLRLCFWYVLLGFLSAGDNLMYAWAYAYLPASTASLVAASSLVFSAIFGRLIVKNRLHQSSLNAIVVITAGVVIVALDSGSDRYPGTTGGQYALGFALDVLASALHGLIFALSELVFADVLGRGSFHVVLEQQAAVSLCAFAFTSAGLAVIGEGFAAMRREAAGFRHGEAANVMVVVWSAVTFQLGVLGATGVVFLASTVLAGVLNAVRVPLTSVGAVIWFHDPMSGFKILSLVITVWGFGSYMVGHSSSVKKPAASN